MSGWLYWSHCTYYMIHSTFNFNSTPQHSRDEISMLLLFQALRVQIVFYFYMEIKLQRTVPKKWVSTKKKKSYKKFLILFSKVPLFEYEKLDITCDIIYNCFWLSFTLYIYINTSQKRTTFYCLSLLLKTLPLFSLCSFFVWYIFLSYRSIVF